jgi:hypothetical protein
MKLELIRQIYTLKSTIGQIFIDGKHECFSLERPDANNAPGVSCILEGEYNITLYYSPHLQRIVMLLHDVPGRDMIEIHPANHPLELKGCIAPGVVKGQDAVWSSVVAFDDLFNKVKAALDSGEKVSISIAKEKQCAEATASSSSPS